MKATRLFVVDCSDYSFSIRPDGKKKKLENLKTPNPLPHTRNRDCRLIIREKGPDNVSTKCRRPRNLLCLTVRQ